MIDVRIQAADFDAGRQVARLAELGRGAIASLLLLAKSAEDVTEILIEHYPAMAKAELSRIAGEADERWALGGIVLVHRHGRLAPGERMILVAAAASDATAAQQACAYIAGELRRRAPFWRKDVTADGGRWIANQV
jgi:molybdopterin synthase catalytic subunit